MAAVIAYPRPKGMSFPSTWIRFKGKKPMEDGRVPEFWVQDVPFDMFETVVGIMCSDYATESPFSRAARLYEDPVSMEESRANWWRHLKSRLSLVALTSTEHDLPVIAGINVLAVVNKNDPFPMQGQGRARRMINNIVRAQERESAVLERYGEDRALCAVGLLVRRPYRGQGVAEQLLRARDPLCRALGFRLTYTCFTSIGAQTAATRAGFEVVHERRYDDYRDEEGNAVMSSASVGGHDSYKIMAKVILPDAEPTPAPSY